MVSQRVAPIARREERRGRVGDLLLAGRSLSEIAGEIGCCKTTASADVKHLRREWAASRVETFDEQVAIQERRLQRLLSVYWGPAMSGDLDAAEFVLKALAATCKLFGLDAATRLEMGIEMNQTVELTATVEWREVLVKIRQALTPFPEARVAVADALTEGDRRNGA